jgi:hypothetical protein
MIVDIYESNLFCFLLFPIEKKSISTFFLLYIFVIFLLLFFYRWYRTACPRIVSMIFTAFT